MKLEEAEPLAARFGTPFYLYDMDAALEHLARLRAALPDCVDVYYAVKANPNRAVLEAFRPHVAGLDISSAGEVEIAAAVGHDPARMSFAGPGKTDREIEAAIRAGVGLLSLESAASIARTAARVPERRRQDVTLRINPLEVPPELAMRMGGAASQFGIPEEEAGPAIAAVLAEPRLHLRGLHVYAGTQCLSVAAIAANVRGTLSLCRRLADEHSLHPEIVNLGGGFGVPYFEGQEALDPALAGAAVGEAVRAFVAESPRFAATRFILELGRFLVGSFGAYVARVVEVKESRGKRFVILDGGMNHCFPATGNFGQVVKKNYPVVNLSSPPGAETAPQEVCGPMCTPLDSMARAVRLPPAKPGDLLAFLSVGAYAFSASPLLFLSHETPIELVRRAGEVVVGRDRIPASRW
jgi:diaminopimelate decarboxylase